MRTSRWIVAIAAIVSLLSFLIYHRFGSDGDSATSGSTRHALGDLPGWQVVQGRVSSGDEAIAGGTVCIYGAAEKNRLDKECARSGGNGEYSIAMPAGDYVATASADGYESDIRSVSVAATKQMVRLDFSLQAAKHTLAGFVQDGAGRAIGEAQVTVYRDDVLVSNAVSDKSGRFSAWAPGGAVALAVSADGYQRVRLQSYAPSADILVTMIPGFSIAGEVVTATNRQPVANIRVTAARDATGVVDARDRIVMTNERGEFVFDGLPPGRTVFGVDSRHLSGRSIIELTPQSREEKVTVVVRSAQEVAGRLVVAPENSPCPAGELALIPQDVYESISDGDLRQAFSIDATDDAKPRSIATTVGKNGAIELPAVPSGHYAVIVNCREHQFVVGPSRLDVGTSDIANLEWRFERGLSVEVSVVDENNRELEGARVSLKPMTSTAVSLAIAKANPLAYAMRVGSTDEQGKYRFGRTPPGKYEVAAQSGASAQSSQRIELVEGMSDQQIMLVLPLVGGIEILAHTADHEPLSRCLFYAVDSAGKRFEARYVGDGRYTIGPLPRGQYRVTAYDNKNPKQVVPGSAGEWVRVDREEPVKLSYQYEIPAGSITGIVRDSTGNTVVAAVQAVSSTLDAEDEKYAAIQVARHGEQFRTTDEQGRFRIDGLQPHASFRLFVQSRSGAKIERKNVSPGEFVQIALPALASISGKVLTASGSAANDFVLVIENGDLGNQETRTFKNTGGIFKLDDVSPGAIDVAVLTLDTHEQASTSFKIAPGEARSGLQLVVGASDE